MIECFEMAEQWLSRMFRPCVPHGDSFFAVILPIGNRIGSKLNYYRQQPMKSKRIQTNLDRPYTR